MSTSTSERRDAASTDQRGHRERLIAAMAASIESTGYRDTTVADVVRLARTSRRSFYEHFADRDACFLALFDATNEELMHEVAAAADPGASLEVQVEAAIDAYIDHVAALPALYASIVRELPGLGDAGAARARAALERMALTLIELSDAARGVQPEVLRRPLTMDTAIIIVGGLRELTVISLQAGRDVHDLRASVAETITALLRGMLL